MGKHTWYPQDDPLQGDPHSEAVEELTALIQRHRDPWLANSDPWLGEAETDKYWSKEGD